MSAVNQVLISTWSKSPIHLPLAAGSFGRWLRGGPFLATAAFIVILYVWFTDCSYILLLTWLMGLSALFCLVFLIWHYYLLKGKKTQSRASVLLVIVCFGWSISGPLVISAGATLLIAWNQSEEAYRNNPLALYQLVGGEKRKAPDIIYLTANLPAHFRAEMDECHDRSPDISFSPNLGELTGGTYKAPSIIKDEQTVTLSASSKIYHDTQSVSIILLPDIPNIKRNQYPGEDQKNRKAIFDFIIISKNDSWVYKSDSLVEKNRLNPSERSEKPYVQTPVCNPILNLSKSRQFDAYVDIICIGTASREGTQTEETERANKRGEQIAKWVNEGLRKTGRTKNVYTMNLGKYMPQVGEDNLLTKDETAQERPVILIGVVREGEIDLTDAINNMFNQYRKENDFLRFLAIHYPRREINLFNKLPENPICSE